MNFTRGAQNITLQGMVEGIVHIASKKQASKMNISFKKGCTLLMIHVTTIVEVIPVEFLQKLPKDL